MNTIPTIETLLHQSSDTQDELQPARFKVEWADCVYDASTPLEFLVGDMSNGLITKGSVNLLVGEGGSKKTWAALDLAACVSIGKNWLDFPTQQTNVLIVDEESGPRRLRRRLYETLSGHLVKRDDNPPIAFTSLSMLNLRESDDVTALDMLIRETRAGLVIVDALADITAGADENSVKDIQPVFMNLRRVAEVTQAAIVVIHHSNKQNGYRGSTAIKGAVDLMLMVDSPISSKYITFNAEKARDIEPKKFTALATWTEGQFYLSPTDINPKAQTNKSQRHVLRYLLEHPHAGLDEITDGGMYTVNTIRAAVQSLTKYITNENAGKTGRGNKAVFILNAEGEELAKGEL